MSLQGHANMERDGVKSRVAENGRVDLENKTRSERYSTTSFIDDRCNASFAFSALPMYVRTDPTELMLIMFHCLASTFEI